MWTYDAMGTYVLVLTLATIFVTILVFRQRRTQKDVAFWVASGLVGILLGAAGAAAAVQIFGYNLVKVLEVPSPDSIAPVEDTGSQADAGSGMGMMGMGGPGGGMGGPGGGMGRGGGGPSPKRQLTTLVRKIDLLTGDVALNLSDEQTAALAEILAPLKSQATMTDDQATAAYEEIFALLDDDQKAKQDAVGLPFRRGGRGGGGFGGRGGPGGGGEEDESANPFTEEQNAEALQSLLARFGAPAADEPAADADSPATTAEQPAAPE
jgi:hypothetical protein